MFNNLIGKNKELGRFLFCERYTLPPVKNAMYIAEGQELKRGAVVDVNGVLVGTNSLMPYAVLEFDCDTRSGGKEASVFIKGEFNFDKLTFADGLEKSDLDNIVYNGSGLGIVIKPYEYAEGFSPLMVQQSSNIAPNYTKTTYPANSYVMQDGVLYTNPNAIGTAEDWNPAHWTQTTVAEMMARDAAKWTHRTEILTINGGQTNSIDIQDHEYVDLTAQKGTGAGAGNLDMHLHGECYVRLQKGFIVATPYVGDGDTVATIVNTGVPKLNISDTSVITLAGGSGIPDDYDPNEFETANAVAYASLETTKPSPMTSSDYTPLLLHYLGEGTLIVNPLPE